MATTDEALQKKVQHVEDLRQKVADAQAENQAHASGLSNESTAAALDAETVRLEAELVEAKRISKLDAKPTKSSSEPTIVKEK